MKGRAYGRGGYRDHRSGRHPARRWLAVETAYTRWRTLGQPGWHQFGLTITEDTEQRVWFQAPNNPHTWQLP